MKNNTGSPLERRMNRIRNTPAPTPRILAIILYYKEELLDICFD